MNYHDNKFTRRRVLKPPGGGSSDIFGSDSVDSRPRARNGRQQEASIGSVFQQSDAPSATPTKARIDSHSRLFGPPPESQATPSKNRLKSNIPIGEVVVNGQNGHGNGHGNGHAENGHTNGDTSDRESSSSRSSHHGYCNLFFYRNDYTRSQKRINRRPDGNPVTGNGYAENGMNGHGSIENGHSNGNGLNGHSNGRRVPPGGFSSGLW